MKFNYGKISDLINTEILFPQNKLTKEDITLALVNKTPFILNFDYCRQNFLLKQKEILRVRVKSNNFLSVKIANQSFWKSDTRLRPDTFGEKLIRDIAIECRLFSDQLKLLSIT